MVGCWAVIVVLHGRCEVTLIDKKRELALHGPTKVLLDTLARLLLRRTEAHVKLH